MNEENLDMLIGTLEKLDQFRSELGDILTKISGYIESIPDDMRTGEKFEETKRTYDTLQEAMSSLESAYDHISAAIRNCHPNNKESDKKEESIDRLDAIAGGVMDLTGAVQEVLDDFREYVDSIPDDRRTGDEFGDIEFALESLEEAVPNLEETSELIGDVVDRYKTDKE